MSWLVLVFRYNKGLELPLLISWNYKEHRLISFRALSHYPNGEIRWLDVDFLADVSTGGNSQVTLIKGSATTANNLAQETEKRGDC